MVILDSGQDIDTVRWISEVDLKWWHLETVDIGHCDVNVGKWVGYWAADVVVGIWERTLSGWYWTLDWTAKPGVRPATGEVPTRPAGADELWLSRFPADDGLRWTARFILRALMGIGNDFPWVFMKAAGHWPYISPALSCISVKRHWLVEGGDPEYLGK